MTYSTYYYSLLSGCLGASASCFAKLAFDTTTLPSNGVTTIGVDADPSYGYTIHVCQHLIRSTSATAATAAATASAKISSTVAQHFYDIHWNDPNIFCEWSVFVICRIMCLLGMIVCNIYMIGTFLKGMDESGTIAGTALSTSSNFIVSAIYGYYIWEERHTSLWWLGFTMVCIGMTILTQCCSTKMRSPKTAPSNDHVKNE